MSRKKRQPLFQCGRCHKRYSSPLGHTCTVKTDYKKRSAKAAREAAAAKRKTRPQHPPPSACQDGDCRRGACVAYREGREDGRREGREEGFEDGFKQGQNACSREHK
jgi:hypothetical protein